MNPTNEFIWKACVTGIPSWSDVKQTSIKAERLLGMSNAVMAITISDPVLLSKRIEPSRVVLRVYPTKPNRTANRKREQAIFNYLSKENKGVKTIYSCDDYRVEEFFDGNKFSTKELHDRNNMKELAGILCNFNHDKGLYDVIAQFDPKTPFVDRMLTEWQPLVANEFQAYVKAMKTSRSKSMMKSLLYVTTSEFVDEYKELSKGMKDSELVASHTDFYELNIMKSKDKSKLIAIDYEYSSINYRANDIVNMYMETGIDYTLPTFPFYTYKTQDLWTDEELTYFIKCYLERDAYMKGIKDVKDYVNLETPKLFREVKIAEPLVSAMWVVWTLLMTDWETFEETKAYNLEYAVTRFEMYQKSKIVVKNMK